MRVILQASRHVVVVAVLGCLVMFAVVTIYGAIGVALAVQEMSRNGPSFAVAATVTVSAFKILDMFLLGGILYIVALGLGALFLHTETALPAWFEVRELQDLKVILSQSVIVVILVAFLGDVLEWEKGRDILYVGGGVAMVIAAVAFMMRDLPRRGRQMDAGGPGQ